MKTQQLTFTRFLAAISIVIYHYGEKTFFYNNSYISFFFKQANIGVSYFYILSGFIMIYAYSNRQKIKIFDFYKNRFARIYPMYLFALFLFIIATLKIPKWQVLMNIFAIQAWIPKYATSLNYPGWSISVEVFFYLLFPYLFNHFYKLRKTLVFVIVLLIWISSQLFINEYNRIPFYNLDDNQVHGLVYYFPIMHLNQFLLGNLLGFFFLKNYRAKNYDLVIVLLLFLLALLLKYSALNYHNGLMAIIFCPLIYFLSSNTGFITKIFNAKILQYLGEISFSIYILQYPIYLLVRSFYHSFEWGLDDLEKFLLYIVILVVISGFSFEIIEKPLRKRIKMYRLNK